MNYNKLFTRIREEECAYCTSCACVGLDPSKVLEDQDPAVLGCEILQTKLKEKITK